jgi:K+-transporting ATPase ATPase C chain
MFSEFFRSLKVTLILALILCGIYPAAVWLAGNVLFHDQATGGIVYVDGKPIGAKLIGQAFTKPEYFHGRPSAAGNGYDAANSSGSNLGSLNPKLLDRMKADLDQFLKDNATVKKGEVPVELVTASGSGLDPHLSEPAALIQVARIAKARNLSEGQVIALVKKNVEGRDLGVLGEPVINVLNLNLQLDLLAKGK